VLRLLNDRVQIGFTADAVCGVRIARAPRQRIVEKHALPCTPEPGAPEWRGPLAALRDLISRLGPRSAEVTLIVSNRFARYALVPWSEKVSTAGEEVAYARHRFGSILGEESQRWEVRLSPSGNRSPRIASAMDPELIEGLRSAFNGSRLRLVSIQPYLMAAFNLWRHRLGTGDRLFLVAESRCYAGAAMRGDQWTAVHTANIRGRFADELPVILDREYAWSALSGRPAIFLHAPDQLDTVSLETQSWTVNSLLLPRRDGFSPSSDTQVGMAMSVA
jgi:hypothetical protein